MLKSVNHYWTRKEVEADKAYIYLFGDNLEDAKPDKRGKYHVPSSTQAVIRGLQNTVGIATKKTRGTGRDAYFYDTDADFELFKSGVDEALARAKAFNKPIKISAYGMGVGAAAVLGAFKSGTGRFFDYLYTKLGELA
jgi:hypothetical protein